MLFKECNKIQVDVHASFIPPEVKDHELLKIVFYENPYEILSEDTINNFFKINLTIEKIVLFSGVPKRPLTSIHIDSHSKNTKPTGAINLVLPNCNSWAIQWFDCEPSSGIIQSDRGSNFIKFEDTLCHMIESCKFYRPFLMRVDVPHRAINNDNNVMHCVSIRFLNDNFYELLPLV